MKICLVVDDSDVIRKVAHCILEDLQMVAVEAADGQEAIDQCRAAMPDAILLDWHMPNMAGVDVIPVLRKLENGDRPTIFFCTTMHDAKTINLALSEGADHFILKPYDRDSIAAKFAEAGLI